MNVKTKVSTLLTLLTLSACQPDSGSSTRTAVPKPAPQETPQPSPGEIIPQKNVITAEGVEIILRKDSDSYFWESQRSELVKNLNQYKVKIRIPSAIVKDVRVFKVDLDKDLQEEIFLDEADVDDKKIELIDRHSLDTYLYLPRNISYKVVTEDRILAEASFELLPDLLVTSEKSASDIKLRAGSYRFANIVLEKDAVLKTQGLELNFVAQNMYVDNAQITTFGENTQPAEIGMPGLDGGNLHIKVNKIEGDIVFKMYGQKGGQGYPGLDNSNAPKGKDGAIGSPAEVKFGSPYVSSGNPGFPPRCLKNPTNGAPGDDGVVGGTGYEGAKGGNSGRVILIYDRADNFKANLISKAGDGGDRGVGGAGGPPGKGGAAGAPPRKGAKFCPKASNGPDGKPGKQGDPGKRGEPGRTENSCISQTNETNTCN